jgi:DNA-directed RNA polymerase specialized sigma24 family protein
MDREEALRRLPPVCAEALRLAEAGLDHAAIAAALDLDPAAVGPLLEIGAAKLARLLAKPNHPDHPAPSR